MRFVKHIKLGAVARVTGVTEKNGHPIFYGITEAGRYVEWRQSGCVPAPPWPGFQAPPRKNVVRRVAKHVPTGDKGVVIKEYKRPGYATAWRVRIIESTTKPVGANTTWGASVVVIVGTAAVEERQTKRRANKKTKKRAGNPNGWRICRGCRLPIDPVKDGGWWYCKPCHRAKIAHAAAEPEHAAAL